MDTIFSIGKLQKGHTEIDNFGDKKFFAHFFKEMQQEFLGTNDEFSSCSRISSLSPIEMAYLSKGIANLSPFFDKENKLLEKQIKLEMV